MLCTPCTGCPVKGVHHYKKRVSMPTITFLLLSFTVLLLSFTVLLLSFMVSLLDITVVYQIYCSLLNFMSMMRRTDSSSRASEIVPSATACVNAS